MAHIKFFHLFWDTISFLSMTDCEEEKDNTAGRKVGFAGFPPSILTVLATQRMSDLVLD